MSPLCVCVRFLVVVFCVFSVIQVPYLYILKTALVEICFIRAWIVGVDGGGYDSPGAREKKISTKSSLYGKRYL